LVFAVSLGLPGFSNASEWQQTGAQHAEFARALGDDGIRFDPKLLEWMSDFTDGDGDCPGKPAAKNLPERERQRVELFRSKYCRPWNQAWRVCDSGRPPSWCGAPSTVAGEFEKYFDTLSTALNGTRGALQRYNIMAVVIAATGVHAITEFPADRVDQWVARSVSEFLRTATPGDAIQIVGLLHLTWFGPGPTTTRHLKAYVASRPMSEEERRLLNAALNRSHAN
jgi:hypothetical protein